MNNKLAIVLAALAALLVATTVSADEWKSTLHAHSSGSAEAKSGYDYGYGVKAETDSKSYVVAKGSDVSGTATGSATANAVDWWGNVAKASSETMADVAIDKEGGITGSATKTVHADADGEGAWAEADGSADAKGYAKVYKKKKPTPPEPHPPHPPHPWGPHPPHPRPPHPWGPHPRPPHPPHPWGPHPRPPHPRPWRKWRRHPKEDLMVEDGGSAEAEGER